MIAVATISLRNALLNVGALIAATATATYRHAGR
jgi:hypothetical protein